jgi:hypothetical protein
MARRRTQNQHRDQEKALAIHVQWRLLDPDELKELAAARTALVK